LLYFITIIRRRHWFIKEKKKERKAMELHLTIEHASWFAQVILT